MATTKKKKTKEDYAKDAMDIGLGIAGGWAANQATSFLEKQTWLGPAAPHSAAFTALVGMGIKIFVPIPAAKSFGLGMAIVSGTEEVEGLIGMAMGAMGMTDKQLGLGFTAKVSPNGSNPVFVNGVAVR